jgi:NAD-dependent SIR2 family protein deacetylase
VLALMENSVNIAIARAVDILNEADAVLLLTGAGMSVDSGLSAYRGSARSVSMWINDHGEDLFTKHGVTYEGMASPEALVDTPALAWGFFWRMQQGYMQRQPHEGYAAALRMFKDKEAFAVTSNVDGYHFRSGWHADRLLEAHGADCRWQCANHGKETCLGLWNAPDSLPHKDNIIDAVTGEMLGPLPQCPACGGLARPNVCLFRDVLWVPTVTREQRARLDQWLESVKERGKRLAILEIGAGTAINTIRHWGAGWAREFGAKLIRINPDDAHVNVEAFPCGGVGIAAGAKESLLNIEAMLNQRVK